MPPIRCAVLPDQLQPQLHLARRSNRVAENTRIRQQRATNRISWGRVRIKNGVVGLIQEIGGGKIGMVQDVEDFPSELHVESL